MIDLYMPERVLQGARFPIQLRWPPSESVSKIEIVALPRAILVEAHNCQASAETTKAELSDISVQGYAGAVFESPRSERAMVDFELTAVVHFTNGEEAKRTVRALLFRPLLELRHVPERVELRSKNREGEPRGSPVQIENVGEGTALVEVVCEGADLDVPEPILEFTLRIQKDLLHELPDLAANYPAEREVLSKAESLIRRAIETGELRSAEAESLSHELHEAYERTPALASEVNQIMQTSTNRHLTSTAYFASLARKFVESCANRVVLMNGLNSIAIEPPGRTLRFRLINVDVEGHEYPELVIDNVRISSKYRVDLPLNRLFRFQGASPHE